MSLRAAIHAQILADPALTALIGTGEQCAHYAENGPENAPRAFILSYLITGGAESTHGADEDTLDSSIIQFNCYAPTLEDAAAIRTALRAALLPGLQAEGQRIVTTSPATRDSYEPELRKYRADLDLTFFHNPNV